MTALPRAVRVERARAGMAFADVVMLDYDMRHRRRVSMTGRGGLAFLLDLAATTVLRGGDVLVLDDGRLVAVEAALEPLAKIRCDEEEVLLRIAWHLGNRHLPIMLFEKRIYIRRDHVIEEMVRGLGGIVHHVEAAFDPEGGAYAGGGHSHGHAHG